MTFEELNGDCTSVDRMEAVSMAFEELLTNALYNGWVTIGVYESAKALNADPDDVVLCILATDDEDEKDVALQIHFTLIKAFCCENEMNIVRMYSTRRLGQILGAHRKPRGEKMDLHCILVTNPPPPLWKSQALWKVHRFCNKMRLMDQWVPVINFPER